MLINDKSRLKRDVKQIGFQFMLKTSKESQLIWQTQADCSILSDRQQWRLGLQT